jgi:hypothetical protein
MIPFSPLSRSAESISRAVLVFLAQKQFVSTNVEGIDRSEARVTADRSSSKFAKGSPPVKWSPWFSPTFSGPPGAGRIFPARFERICSRSVRDIQSADHSGPQA